MRPITALALIAALALAGCGSDDGDPPDDFAGSADRPTRDPAADIVSSDTVAGDSGAAHVGAPDRAPEGAPVGTSDSAGEAAGPGASGDIGRLYTVQIAAFTDAARAREWAARLSADDLPTWISEARIDGRTYHRVRVGAAPTVEAARRVGAVVHARYDWPVWIAPLTAADRLPPGAVQDTRRFIEGG